MDLLKKDEGEDEKKDEDEEEHEQDEETDELEDELEDEEEEDDEEVQEVHEMHVDSDADSDADHPETCEKCGSRLGGESMLLCGFPGPESKSGFCDEAWHMACLDPPLKAKPTGEWYCPTHSQPQGGKLGCTCPRHFAPAGQRLRKRAYGP